MTTQTRTLATGGNPEERFPVPLDDYFDAEEAQFIPAPEVEKIGHALIQREEGLKFLRQATIVYLWRQKGGKSKGGAVLGKCQKPSGLLRYFAEADYVVWLGADHCRDAGLARWQVEALVYHELNHPDQDEKTGKWTLRGHDFEDFRAVVQRYGAWDHGLQAAEDAFQARLFDGDAATGAAQRLHDLAEVNGAELSVSINGQRVTGGPEAVAEVLESGVRELVASKRGGA